MRRSSTSSIGGKEAERRGVPIKSGLPYRFSSSAHPNIDMRAGYQNTPGFMDKVSLLLTSIDPSEQ